MARRKKSAPTVKQNIQEVVQNALGTVLSLEKIYKDTQRKAGYTVPGYGAPRDAIDQRDLINSLEIEEIQNGLLLILEDGDNPVMFDRPEIEEEIMNNLDIAEIAGFLIGKHFGGKIS